MTISVGDCIPNCTLAVMGGEGPAPVTTAELFNGKKALLFAVPGAFTPGCSMTHLPGYVAIAIGEHSNVLCILSLSPRAHDKSVIHRHADNTVYTVTFNGVCVGDIAG